MSQKKVVLIGYYGTDGACAVAAALLKYPQAEVLITSAQRIGASLAVLSGSKTKEVHVCGTGVRGDWDTLEQSALALAREGTRIWWHCGREYLDEYVDRFKRFCSPVFRGEGSNTAGVVRTLELTNRVETGFLMELALYDSRIAREELHSKPAEEHSNWLDLIEAATAQYLKYQDEDTYVRVVRKLASRRLDAEDIALITAFRRAGYRYLLHGKSPAIRQLKERIGKCATADRNLLITGESGVGKEHVARLLWEGSSRAAGPFVALNCAICAGNISLANSDLFGHSKGAFTGADRSRSGKFIEADGGVLFLDELSELPLEVQAKLLRVLEDGSIIPEGADRPLRQVSVRVLAATNRDIPAQIRSGAFRADLYHRISVLRIHIPPLRERLEDLSVIIQQKLELLKEEGYAFKWKASDLKLLQDYSWPGNVRQLLKIVERAVLLNMPLSAVMEEEIALGELAEGADEDRRTDIFRPNLRSEVKSVREIQATYARHVWELFDGNYRAAAHAMGVNVNTLRYNYLNQEKEMG